MSSETSSRAPAVPLLQARRRSRALTFFERYIRPWFGYIIAAFAVLTFVTGFLGFLWQYSEQRHTPEDWTIPFYKTFQLYLLNSAADDDPLHQSNWLLAISRLSVIVLFLLVSAAAITKLVKGMRRVPKQILRSDHVVICGLGKIGVQLFDDLVARDPLGDIVVIEPDVTTQWVEYAANKGAEVNIADATQRSSLQFSNAEYAAEVFAVTGDDGANLEVAAELAELVTATRLATSARRSVDLYVHIADIDLAIAIQPHVKAISNTDGLNLHVFNVARNAASELVGRRLWEFAPHHTTEVAHFVLLGFGPMGQAVAVQLAQLAHFPNRKRSRFTIADRDIDRLAAAFMSRYPRFTRWTHGKPGVSEFRPSDDEWGGSPDALPPELRTDHADAVEYVANARFTPAPLSAGDELFARTLAAELRQPGVKPVIFVCGQKDSENFDSAVRLRDALALQGLPAVPIFVWLPRQPALAQTLLRDKQFLPFGECRTAAGLEQVVNPLRERLGRKFHDHYERMGIKQGWKTKATPWEESPEMFRESNRQAADHLAIKLAYLQFWLLRDDEKGNGARLVATEDQTHVLAEMEHNRWIGERLMTGWRFAPEGKANKALKQNHNLVAWDKLTRDKQKDYDQIAALLEECKNGTFHVAPMS
jgi:voltage-gated potassium channel Kch